MTQWPLKTFDKLFSDQIARFRAGQVEFEEFAIWCEDKIEEQRVKADFLVNECQTELYMSFAERAGMKGREGVETMEAGFEYIFAFLDGGEEELLDEALPYFQRSVALYKESIELIEECMELDGGLHGMI